MGIVVVGATFVDIKGYPEAGYIPTGRNAGWIQYVHGGVARNVAEDIANVELRPTFLSVVDDSALGQDVVQKLKNHKVNTDYLVTRPDGMGTWLVVFDSDGEVAGSISKRPNMMPLKQLLDEKGDEIFAAADSVVIETDIDKEVVKAVLDLAEKHGKKVFGLVSNMTLAAQRRDFIQRMSCFICNQQEAGILFLEDYEGKSPEEMRDILSEKVQGAKIPSMVVTMGAQGAVYADMSGAKGACPARKVAVADTSGAGDAFCAGMAIALTYGKDMEKAIEIGSMLAASVITSYDNVCPRFQPGELGLDVQM